MVGSFSGNRLQACMASTQPVTGTDTDGVGHQRNGRRKGLFPSLLCMVCSRRKNDLSGEDSPDGSNRYNNKESAFIDADKPDPCAGDCETVYGTVTC